MTTVRDALAGVTRLGVDTAPVIYFIEANPRYDLTGLTSVTGPLHARCAARLSARASSCTPASGTCSLTFTAGQTIPITGDE